MPDFYGPSTSPLQGGLPTDRLVAEWWLRSARVRQTLGETWAGASESAQFVVQVPVPAAVREWKQNPEQRKLAESLQTRNRLALESAFSRGLAITGYERSPQGDGCFLVGPVSGLEEPGTENKESPSN
jgi:predicted GNAT superfamily acetyltransferase